MSDRLRGVGQNLAPCYTSAENTPSPAYVQSYDMTGATLGSGNAVNGSGLTYIEYFFKRAPSFFDEVCYTGTGSALNVTHNLTVAPELIIAKSRSYGPANWPVYSKSLNGGVTPQNYGMYLSVADGEGGYPNFWNNTAPTATTFTVGSGNNINGSGQTYVAYLFATCPGVSKVTSFTGNGSTQTINCGFTSGARFVLIKATSTTGNWLVFDTARGMTTSTDPWLALNLTSAESATTGACTTVSSGFAVDESKLTGVNTNGVSYIALAVA
jgi:hypothetical protein